MKWHFNYKYALILCLILLGAGFYIYNLMPHPNTYIFAFKALPDVQETDESAAASGFSSGTPSSGIKEPSLTPAPSGTPGKTKEAIKVRGTTISLGESTDSIIKKLGAPGRIDETEYDFDFYIYNNDYRRLLFVAVREDNVVGYYTDSVDFDYQGICSGSDIGTVGKALKQTFSIAEILSQTKDTYTVQVLMDKLVSKKVTGIYVLQKDVKLDEYTDNSMKGVEQMVYDLTNSIRLRNNIPVLSWSSSAAQASRKHSADMALSGFFGHINLRRETSADRIRTEGIYFKKSCENIIAGYGTAISSTHKLFNSKTQRNNMLNSDFRYLGTGFVYSADSTYKTYLTQNFYR